MDRLWQFVARRIVATGELAVPSSTSPIDETEESSPDDIPPESVFHEAAKAFLDQQVASNRDLDTRSAQSFQVGSVVVTITFGLLGLNKTQAHVPGHAKWALYAALGCYVAVAVFAFLASLRRRIEYRPDIQTLDGYLDEFAGTSLRYWVALEYADSIAENRAMLSTKSRLVGAGVLFLYLEGVCLAAAALFTLF